MASPLQRLSTYGQSVWIDFLSRDLLRSGGLAQAIERDGVAGVTSNPTIFAKALTDTDAYDDQLAELWTRERDLKDVFLHLATDDVEHACDLLFPIWRQSEGLDGYVSIEVDPRLAATPRPRFARRSSFTPRSRGRTCWSRFQPPKRVSRPSRR
jgi:transaldolase